MHPPPTGIITFLFTDIESSTQLWEQYPDAMRGALARHDACLRAAIEAHHGQVFKTVGDAFCAAFSEAPHALRAAIAAQQSLQALGGAGSVGVPLRARIALHSGAAERREGDYFGPTLNRIARLLAVGHGGQVLLSQRTRDLLQDALPAGVSLRDLGSHRLRDLLQPERIYQLLHAGLPADFPPLKSLSSLAHNLPQQVTRFVGREREIAQVRQFLATTRLLTLTGTGGAGKTRLALQVAAELVSEYEEGVWLVELAALSDPALVPQAVAAALRVREELDKPITPTLAEALRPRQLLLILDNCEHLLPACAGLVHTLLESCPNLRVLATSRERLNIRGEQTYRVPSLSAPQPSELPPGLDDLARFEAVQMFLDRAALVQSTFTLAPQNAPAVARVCHQLDGIPLALELAAARLRVLSVEQIAQRLDDRFRLLTGGSRTALPRQQTLRALIDWSYALLSEAERTVLQRLSVFAGGFTLEAAEAVCAGGAGVGSWELGVGEDKGPSLPAPTPNSQLPTPEAVLDLLGQLVEKSLVMATEQDAEPRYRLLETIRQYGSEKLWEAGEGAVARWRYRGWALRRAEEALAALPGPEREVWLQRLVVEFDNLRAALGPAARPHPSEEAAGERGDLPLLPARLARWGQVVEQLVPVYRQIGRGEAARGVLEDFIALCQTEGDPRWLARACTLMGRFLELNPGRAERATHRSMYERAIAVCEAHALHDRIIHPQSHLAYELAASGADPERAEAVVRACLPQAKAQQNPEVLRRLYTSLMWKAVHQANGEALRSAFHASLACGGPLEIPLHLMLTRIEETCHRQGLDAQFVELCRDLADGYARAGLEAPYVAWHLGATASRPLLGPPSLREAFDEGSWGPSLRWQDVTGRSQADCTSRPGWLGLYPAEGANLWPVQDLNAPRLVAAVKGDFVAQTRLELGQQTQVLAGLLVWRDEGHFARLELQLRSLGGERPTVQLEACVGGRFRVIGRGQHAGQPLWLRVEREGEELRGLCSADGEGWLTCGSVRFPPGVGEERSDGGRAPGEQVGIAAICHGPNAHAWFDTFLLWEGKRSSETS